jgi:EpsI family protein
MMRGSFNFLVTVTLLGLTVTLFEWSDRRPAEYLAQSLDTIHHEIDGWQFDGTLTLDSETLRVLNPSEYLSRSYRKNSQRLGLFIAFYAQQRAGETMHSPKNCLPGSGWEIWKSEIVDASVDGARFQINKYFIQNVGRRLIVYYWYQSRYRIIANEYLGKLLLVGDAIRDADTAGALVRVTVPDEPEVSSDALRFSAGVIPQIRLCFGHRR